MKYFKMFIICEICPADHLKVGEKGLQRQFPRYLQFCVTFLYLKFGAMNFFYQHALGREKICNFSGNSIRGNAINLAQKIPIFFVTKHYVME